MMSSPNNLRPFYVLGLKQPTTVQLFLFKYTYICDRDFLQVRRYIPGRRRGSKVWKRTLLIFLLFTIFNINGELNICRV